MKCLALTLWCCALTAQQTPITQTWCGPMAPFQVCGATWSSAHAVAPVFGATTNSGGLRLGWSTPHHGCHSPAHGARVVALAGSHLPAVSAVLPGAFTGTGDNRLGIDPVFCVMVPPLPYDQWIVVLPAPAALQGLTLRYQWIQAWAEANVGYCVMLSNCIEVAF